MIFHPIPADFTYSQPVSYDLLHPRITLYCLDSIRHLIFLISVVIRSNEFIGNLGLVGARCSFSVARTEQHLLKIHARGNIRKKTLNTFQFIPYSWLIYAYIVSYHLLFV